VTTTEDDVLTLAEVTAAIDEAKATKVETKQPEIEPDPLGVDGADIKIGDHAPYVATGRCGQRLAGVPGLGYVNCERAVGHPPHHAHYTTGMSGTVMWVWGKGDPPMADSPDEVEDAAEAKVERWEVGDRVNYRNKRDVLIVLTVPKRKDKEVEVLDLTHERMRKIPRTKVVPPRDDDPEMTADQFKWMARFLAERRKAAIDVAKRELTNRRWDKNAMNRTLEKLDIAPIPPRYQSTPEMSLRVVLPPGAPKINQDELRRRLRAALVKVYDGFEITEINSFYGGTFTEA
jgi:hypothetical protein